MTMILSAIFFVIGLLAGGLINVLADDLPNRERPRVPHCPACGHEYKPIRWLALSRRLFGGKCPDCGLKTRNRTIAVEIGTALLFAVLPQFIEPVVNLVIYTVYVGVLILVIVVDIEHRKVLNVVTYSTTILALIASLFLTDNNPLLAAAGAVAGLLFFSALYLLGSRLFGPTALGIGDVKLAMALGAMLGLQRVFLALIMGIFLAGLWAIIILILGRVKLRDHFAYGPFLAIGGIVMIIWGNQIYEWMFLT